MSDMRNEAHAYLDRLPGKQLSAVHSLLESMLSPLERTLAVAPPDREPLTADDAAGIERGVSSLDLDGGASLDELLAEMDLTLEDIAPERRL